MSSDIVHVLNTILNIKQGKLPAPNTLIVNENVTREIYENDFFKKSNVFFKKRIIPDGVPEKIIPPEEEKKQEFVTTN